MEHAVASQALPATGPLLRVCVAIDRGPATTTNRPTGPPWRGGRTLPGFVPYGWPSVDDAEDELARGTDADDEYERDEGAGGWIDEGLVTLALVAGVVRFVIPEPATSGQVLLVGVGVVAWLGDGGR